MEDNFLKKTLSESDGTRSSKRVMAFVAFAVMILSAIGSLFFDLTIEEFIYESFFWLALGGLGLTSFEKFAQKK